MLELASTLAEARLPAGTVVVREGDTGDRCFLVVAGRAELSVGLNGRPSPLGAVGPGDYFGELALLVASGRRQATVTALTALHVLSLDAQSFREVLAQHEGARTALHQHAERLITARFVKQVGAFTSLETKQLQWIAARVVTRRVGAGELVVRQGEAGKSCYMLRSGSAEVLVTRGGAEEQVAVLAPGTLFGEGALLTDSPRSASVRALEASEVLELSRDAFLEASQDRRVSRELVQLLRLREFPRRLDGVEAHERLSPEGDAVTILKNARLGTYYRLLPRGRFVWERLDGQHDLRRLTLEYLAEFGEFAPQFIADLVGGLARTGFVDVRAVSREVGEAGFASPRWQRAAAAARRIMEWRIGIGGVDRLVTTAYARGVRVLFTRAGLLGLLTVATFGLVAFVIVGRHATRLLAHAHGELLLLVYPGLVISVLIHEAGHAFATKAFGRTVQSAGVGWYWFGPVAFVDTSDMWLGTRRERIAVSLAGPAADLVTAGAVSVAALLVSSETVAAGLWSLALPLYVAVALNLNPLLEFDGYHVLTDLIDRPNLRAEALAWVRQAFPGLLRAPRTVKGHWLELSYGVGSLLYVFAMGALTIVFYRLVLRRLVETILPDQAATALSWVVAGGVVVLALGAAVGDLRKFDDRGGGLA